MRRLFFSVLMFCVLPAWADGHDQLYKVAGWAEQRAHFNDALSAAQQRYRMIVNAPAEVAREMAVGIKAVRQFRRERNDAFHFNWLLKIDESFQRPFAPTHASMAALDLSRGQPVHALAANLRRAFSGIVAGNVKAHGIRMIEEHGPYEIKGDPSIMRPLDRLLHAFVEQHRMKLPGGSAYVPCYRVVG